MEDHREDHLDAILQAFLSDHPEMQDGIYTYPLDDGTVDTGFTIPFARAYTAWTLANDLCTPDRGLEMLEKLAKLEAEPIEETLRRINPRFDDGKRNTDGLSGAV